MHTDAGEGADDGEAWRRYFDRLRASGRFDGGSAIGAGACHRRGSAPTPATLPVEGFIRVRAESLEEARGFLDGNPVYEAGGCVEIRELPRD
jgi:hypothetical protein